MKLATRFTLVFGSLLLALVGVSLYATFQMRAMAQDLEEVASDGLVKVDQFTQVMNNLNAIGRYARNILLSKDEKFEAAERDKIANLRKENGELLATLDRTIVMPDDKALMAIISKERPSYNQAMDRALELDKSGHVDDGVALLLGEVRDRQNVVFKTVNELIKRQHERANEAAQQALDISKRASIVSLVLAVVLGLAGGLMGWYIVRGLRRDLGGEPRAVAGIVSAVADGDLSHTVTVLPGDERSVMAAVARMQRSLAGTVASVRANAESVATASAQIAQGNQDLSGRTEQQAAAIEETAATMDELAATVRNNADNARQANQLALSASATARDGGQVVQDVVGTMRGIQTSSQKISEIIGVIDGIAFQTNILALNAAVEAARAGEQGRGFAVVAGEVRSLAQRSAEAAKEIKSLITLSVEQVEQGTSLVDRAGSTMEQIVASIQRVSDIVGEISSASVEQSQGVAQIGQAVQQMDQGTQQNAALVEESAAAAESLKRQAQTLVQAVAVFKLDGHGAPLAATAPAAPATPKPATQAATRVAARAPVARPAPVRPTTPPVARSQPAPAAPKPAQPAVAATGGSDDWESF